jgi:hypothetical protein
MSAVAFRAMRISMAVAQSKHAVAIGHQVRSGNAFLATCSSHLDEKPV